jgi:single-stranded-DNA-specific exonuclease
MPTASLRAPEGYHLVESMQKCQLINNSLFIKFGGHPLAAGFSVKKSNLRICRKLMLDKIEIKTTIGREFSKSIEIPVKLKSYAHKNNIIWINIEDITNELLKQVFDLDPFGQDFPLPSFGLKIEANNIKKIETIGAHKNHLKLVTIKEISIIFFNLNNQEINNLKDNTIWIIGKPSKNYFKKNKKLDIIVEKFVIDEGTC